MALAKVLIIDDEPVVRRATAALLARDGFDVTQVSSPADVSPLARFAVGIFDINLSGTDGVGFARAMLDAGQVQQAVFYTGGGDELTCRRASAVGTVVVKPELGPLREAVKRLSSKPPRP